MADNFYQVLGVHPQASSEALNRAWKLAARRHHPDLRAHEGADAEREANRRMIEINEAYQTLRVPEARRQYDLAHALIPARCSRCGQPGALRPSGTGTAVAFCDDCAAS
jgi:curved DNA-binding protein CbpA